MIPPTENPDKMKDELKFSTDLDFEVGSEPWITIKVADGAELKIRMVIEGVRRISDNPESGEPRYFVSHKTLLRTSKKPGKVQR
jgi:hypothetical protein